MIAAGPWSGAYYLAGYAVECALKACVLLHIERTGIIFLEKKYAEKCWTHNIEDLVHHANLEAARASDFATNAALVLSWQAIKDWTEASRYQQHSESEAREFVQGVTDSTNGVLQWIRTHW